MSLSYYIAIVDGTGPYKDSSYDESMRHSFCQQLWRLNRGKSDYLRGPSDDGFYIESRALTVVDQVMCSAANIVFIAGYSRGGSVAVIAARMLQERRRVVQALFLFDPVARHLSASSEFVTRNVKNLYIARREAQSRTMDKYDGLLIGHLAGLGGHNPAREWFGRTAVNHDPTVTMKREASFVCSHGALGGVGWRAVKEDTQEQPRIARWFNDALREQNLPAGLESKEESFSSSPSSNDGLIPRAFRKLPSAVRRWTPL